MMDVDSGKIDAEVLQNDIILRSMILAIVLLCRKSGYDTETVVGYFKDAEKTAEEILEGI